MRDKFKKLYRELSRIMHETHLYKSKIESLIKTSIWLVSWIGGIAITIYSTDKRAIASAYLLFSLSLLMEFGQKIKEKKQIVSRLIDCVFCVSGVTLIVLSFACLLGDNLIDKGLLNDFYDIMFVITICQMVFMVLDFICLWVSPDDNPETPPPDDNCSSPNRELPPQSDDGDARKCECADASNDNDNLTADDGFCMFELKLMTGNLGNVKEGDNDNE